MKIIKSFFIFLTLTGCAVFTKKPHVNSTDSFSVVNSSKRIGIKINSQLRNEKGETTFTLTDEILNYSQKNENCVPLENPGVIKNRREDSVLKNPYLGRLLCETILSIKEYGRFKEIEFLKNNEQSKNNEILIEISWEVDLKTSSWKTAWLILNYASLTIIPYRGERDYKLTAKIFSKGNEIKTYYFTDTMVDWSNILLLPAMPFVDGYRSGTEKLHRSLIKNLILKLKEDSQI